jgi:TRAP-type C4-dicarboxylate transport system permease large subunit
MSSELIGVIGIICLFILLAGRLYIGMAMMVVGLVSTGFIIGWDPAVNLLGLLPMNESKSYNLSVIPPSILMGQFAFVSGISTDIYRTVYYWIGHLRGGLAMATVLACAFFAAASGSSLATGATMGMVAIPEMGPPGPSASWPVKIRSLSGTWAMLTLFALVIGGIYTGIFTPTEAAGIGAFGALLIALVKRKINLTNFTQCLSDTGKMTAFIFLIIIKASVFSHFLALTGIPTTLSEYMTGLPLPRSVILLIIVFGYMVLGCVMEVYSIMILTLPIIFPIIQALEFDPIWFWVIMVIVLEVGLITPPIGLNVFILKGAAPDVPVETMFRGIWPFFAMAVLAMVIIALFPQIALYIPSHM